MFEEASGVIAGVGSKIEETRSFIKQVRRNIRSRFTSEEKMHVVLEGFRH